MHAIPVRNVNHALPEALWWLHVNGVISTSRNGPVLVAPASVAVSYQEPLERVLFSAKRDCNPFFHFFEALWMLDGREDVAFVAQFNPRMRDYSDDGRTLHGAYGRRWRRWWKVDQLRELTKLLRDKPDTRQAVLSMWDPDNDLGVARKDLPCNTHCYFDRRGEDGALNVLVCCRSNDAVWGAYGANAVHFSYLLEYLANAVGCPVGRMDQLSFNLHVYTQNEVTKRLHQPPFDGGMEPLGPPCVQADDRYALRNKDGDGPLVEPVPLCAYATPEDWDEDLCQFLDDPGGDAEYRTGFFEAVAAPLFAAWQEYKAGHLELAQRTLESVGASDWALAAHEWLQRRLDKRAVT